MTALTNECGTLVTTEKRLVRSSVSAAYPLFTFWNFGVQQASLRGARAAGLSYERKVEKYLEAVKGSREVVKSLPFRFCDSDGWRMCVPDFLLFDFKEQRCCVVEVKLRHSGAAGLELERLYVPVLRRALPGWKIQGLEICKWYVPGITTTPLVKEVDKWLAWEHSPVRGVHFWGGRHGP